MAIHRIELNGNKKWEFSARYLGKYGRKKRSKKEENGIRLFDFESNEYLIDFDGKLIEDNPRITEKRKPTVLNNLKRWFKNKLWNLTQNRK